MEKRDFVRRGSRKFRDRVHWGSGGEAPENFSGHALFFWATPFFPKEAPFSIWKPETPISIYSFKSNDIVMRFPSLHMEQAFKVKDC